MTIPWRSPARIIEDILSVNNPKERIRLSKGAIKRGYQRLFPVRENKALDALVLKCSDNAIKDGDVQLIKQLGTNIEWQRPKTTVLRKAAA